MAEIELVFLEKKTKTLDKSAQACWVLIDTGVVVVDVDIGVDVDVVVVEDDDDDDCDSLLPPVPSNKAGNKDMIAPTAKSPALMSQW